MRPQKDNSKTRLLFGLLAAGTSVYRPWFWANYPVGPKQEALRAEWARHLSPEDITADDIREGLRRWSVERGVDCPPTPTEFVAFIRPVHTSVSRRGFAGIRAILEG